MTVAGAAGVVSVDPQQTKLLQEYKLGRPLTGCHWDVHSRYVFCGAEDYLIHRVDVGDGHEDLLAGHDSWVRAFGSAPDGETLYSGGYDGRLIFWPVAGERPEPLRVIECIAVGYGHWRSVLMVGSWRRAGMTVW